MNLFKNDYMMKIIGMSLSHIIRVVLATSFILLGLLCSTARCALPGVGITGFRFWSGPDHTRLVLDMQRETAFKAFHLKKPRRLVIDLRGAHLNIKKTAVPVGDQIVQRVRFGIFAPGVVRMVVDLKRQVQHEIFLLKPFQSRPHRLVVDLNSPELAQKEAKERKSFLVRERPRTKVVVIDPGHGGEDPGAIGRRGTKEKYIVLRIARQLKDMLDRKSGFRVFLTRDGDYYVPLRKRYEIAQELGAHLFISLHCDAHRKRSARGASVYTLSQGGATDEAARLLAHKENASDQVAGILRSSPAVNTILLDLVQTHNLNESVRFGDMVLQNLRRVTRLKFSEPRQAGFMVLKAPEMPSILVELGYLSSRHDERLLRSKRFQSRLCGAMVEAIEKYSSTLEFPTTPSPKPASPRYHVVRTGETLWRIAKTYNVKLSKLRKLNHLAFHEPILVGQKLRIPVN